MSITELLPANPTSRLRQESSRRPPDWRWQLAAHLRAQEPPVSRHRDDAAVDTALKFHNRRSACRTEAAHGALRRRYPDVTEAYEIYAEEGGATGDRNEVECWILAGLDSAAIAKKTGLTQPTVECYERLFFDLRDRIDNRRWIVNHVLGAPRPEKQSNGQDSWVLKWCAYFAGSHVLDYLLGGGLNNTVARVSRDEVPNFLASQIQSVLAQKHLLSVLALRPSDPRQMLEFLKLQAQGAGNSQEGAKAIADLKKYETSLKKALAQLPWKVATKENLTCPLDHGPVEPRAATYMRYYAGEKVEVPDLKYPEKKPNPGNLPVLEGTSPPASPPLPPPKGPGPGKA